MPSRQTRNEGRIYTVELMRARVLRSLLGWLEVGHDRDEGMVQREEKMESNLSRSSGYASGDICIVEGGGGAAV